MIYTLAHCHIAHSPDLAAHCAAIGIALFALWILRTQTSQGEQS